MADEATNSTEEAISGQVVEGSIDSLQDATEEVYTPKMVKESDLLALKADRDKLKKELRALKEAKTDTDDTDLDSFSSEYPDVDPNFIKKLAKTIKVQAKKDVEDELRPVIEQQKKSVFDKEYKKLFDSQISKVEGIDTSVVDPEIIKALALTPQYRNTDLSTLIEKAYGHTRSTQGKRTSESDTRSAMDVVKDVVDTEWDISDSQRKAIFSDPKAKKAYFDAKYR